MTNSPLVTSEQSKTVNIIIGVSIGMCLLMFFAFIAVATTIRKHGSDVGAFIEEQAQRIAPQEVISDEYAFTATFPGYTLPDTWTEEYEGIGEVTVASWNSFDAETLDTANLFVYTYPESATKEGFDLEAMMNGMADELGYRIKDVQPQNIQEREALRYSLINQFSLAEGLIIARDNRVYHLFFETPENPYLDEMNDQTAADAFFASFTFTE